MSASAGSAPAKSLFEKLGGAPTLESVVEAFYVRVLADATLKPFFTHTNMKWLKMRQVQFFTQALGGPAVYKGKGMKEAHAKLEIGHKHFARVAEHLAATLAAAGVGQADIDTIIGAVAPLASDIVNTE